MAADLYADYVIVGAGSAGCVLAARLTESRAHTVVLLGLDLLVVAHAPTLPRRAGHCRGNMGP